MNDSNPLMAAIRQARAAGRTALCGYFLAGYRTPEEFYRAARLASRLDVLELGIPSRQPWMDGPTIEQAHRTVVVDRGLLTETSLALIGGLRHLPQPRFVMAYATDGRELRGFLRLCLENHVHGVFAPDLAVDEARHVALLASTMNLAFVSLVTAAMSGAEVAERVEFSDLVYVKVSGGVTGTEAGLAPEQCAQIRRRVARLREQKPEILVAAGIGLKHPDQVARCADLEFDMVVVGTALMQRLTDSDDAFLSYLDRLHAATRGSETRQDSFVGHRRQAS